MSVFIFQSIKELLFYVVKHAETSRASLFANLEDNGCLHIRIQDKGIGFDFEKNREQMARQGAYGLLSIKQRIAYIGGKVKIISEPGKGTCVDIHLPHEAGKIDTECSSEFFKEQTILETSPVRLLIVDDHIFSVRV